MSKITSEGHAKKREQEALEILAEVRQWVWDRGTEWLRTDDSVPVKRFNAEAHAAYRVWYFGLKNAIQILDAGWDDDKIAQLPKPGE